MTATVRDPLAVTLVGLVAGGHGGVPRYASALARALDEVAAEFEALELTLLTTPQGVAEIEPRSLRTRVAGRGALARGAGRLLAEQVLAARQRRTLLHFFDLSGPVLAPRRRFVATVHDASVTHGYRFTALRRGYKRLLQPWALRHAAAVVAVSGFARDEAVERLGADPARVHVVHSGPGLTAATNGIAAVDLPVRPFVLFVGNLTLSKNVPLLVRAFDRSGIDAELLLVGRPGERYEEIEAAVGGARAPVHVIRDASDADLDLLYRNALVLALPSRYEGFGFTALEAMARGRPVLASDIPALREVSGDGAVLLPPDDEGAWSEALRRVASDEPFRAELAARGRAVVQRYSWEKTARRLCELFLAVGK